MRNSPLNNVTEYRRVFDDIRRELRDPEFAKTYHEELLKCLPCEGGVKSLNTKETKGYLKTLQGWRLVRGGKEIETEYKMKNFAAAIDLIQKIARIAEKENHHPDLHLTGYRHLKITLSTHAIRGLSLNDFILASKIQKLVDR